MFIEESKIRRLFFGAPHNACTLHATICDEVINQAQLLGRPNYETVQQKILVHHSPI